MGTFNDVRQQVGQAPPQTGRYVTSAQKRDMVIQRTPFWVTSIDPQPRQNTRFTDSNGHAKLEWVYHCVPLQGGEEFVLTLAANWSRDRETPLLVQRLQQTGQPLGPAVLVFQIPSGGTRAQHMLADWDQNAPAGPVPPAYQPPAQNAGQALAQATQAPAVSWAQPPTQTAPAIPWRPVGGVPVAPQPQQPQLAVQTPPPVPASPPPAVASGQPVLEGGRPVGLAPDGEPPVQYACGCLATRTTRQVYQPCAVHSQPQAAPPAPQVVTRPAQAAAPAAQTAVAMCPRCQQQITGEVTQVGMNRYVTHNNCPADPNPQAYQLLKV